MADLSGQFEVDGLVKTRKELEQLLMSNPEMEKRVQKLIRQVLMQARRTVMNSITFKHGDPRQAVKAVKTSVYRRILGGNVSLYNKRSRQGGSGYEPPRKGVSGRGGNRRQRTFRDMGRYAGSERAFILRWLNNGVGDRYIQNFRSDERRERWPSVPKWSRHPNTGYRGSIAPRNFFADSSHRALQQAAEQLDTLIGELIQKEFNS